MANINPPLGCRYGSYRFNVLFFFSTSSGSHTHTFFFAVVLVAVVVFAIEYRCYAILCYVLFQPLLFHFVVLPLYVWKQNVKTFQAHMYHFTVSLLLIFWMLKCSICYVCVFVVVVFLSNNSSMQNVRTNRWYCSFFFRYAAATSWYWHFD